MRRGIAMALAGPLLEGGFFIPSSSSLSATALLRSRFLRGIDQRHALVFIQQAIKCLQIGWSFRRASAL